MDGQNIFVCFSKDAPTEDLHAAIRQTQGMDRSSTGSDVFTEFEELAGASIDRKITQNLIVTTLPIHAPIQPNARIQSASDLQDYTTVEGRDDPSGDTASHPKIPRIHLRPFASAHIVNDACGSCLSSPDSPFFACEFSGGNVSVFSAWSIYKDLPLDAGVPTTVFTSPSGNLILHGDNGYTCLSSSQDFSKLVQLDVRRVSDCYISSDDRFVASLGDGGTLRLWEVGSAAGETELYAIGHNHTRIDSAAVEGFLIPHDFTQEETREKTHALFDFIDSLRENRVISNDELKTSLNEGSLNMPVIEHRWRGSNMLVGIWNFTDSSLWEVSHHQINPDVSYISTNGTKLANVVNDTLYLYEIGEQGVAVLERAKGLPSFMSRDGGFLAYRTNCDNIVMVDVKKQRILAKLADQELSKPTLNSYDNSPVMFDAKTRTGKTTDVGRPFSRMSDGKALADEMGDVVYSEINEILNRRRERVANKTAGAHPSFRLLMSDDRITPVVETTHVDWSFHSNGENVMIIVNHRKAILYDVANNESVILERDNSDSLDFESRGGRKSWTEVTLGGYHLDVNNSDDDQIRVLDPSTDEKVDTIRVLRGIDLTGLDFSKATMGDDDRKILRQNGAEVG